MIIPRVIYWAAVFASQKTQDFCDSFLLNYVGTFVGVLAELCCEASPDLVWKTYKAGVAAGATLGGAFASGYYGSSLFHELRTDRIEKPLCLAENHPVENSGNPRVK